MKNSVSHYAPNKRLTRSCKKPKNALDKISPPRTWGTLFLISTCASIFSNWVATKKSRQLDFLLGRERWTEPAPRVIKLESLASLESLPSIPRTPPSNANNGSNVPTTAPAPWLRRRCPCCCGGFWVWPLDEYMKVGDGWWNLVVKCGENV